MVRGDSGNDDEPSFVPPEEIAKEEELIDMAEVENKEPDVKDTKQDKKDKKSDNKKPNKLQAAFHDLKFWFNGRTKKQKIIIGVIAGLVVLLLAGGAYALLNRKPAPKAAVVEVKKEEKKEPPKPTTEPSRLTGMPVAPEYNLLPVTGVMIENSPDSRPQAGLNQAGVIFEAVAEGGITRFLTLFQEAQPDYIGPVRSVRPYYLQWLQGFDAPIAHVGGSAEALAKIRNEGIKDLDQSFNGGAYHRISQRYAPHNVYTSLSSLLALEKSKGWTSSTFTGFTRKADKVITPPTARAIDLAISGPLYNVHYDYDAATNTYLRTLAGVPHKDERSGLQLSPKVVIALVMPQGISSNGIHTTYNSLGSNTAYFFQDGAVTVGTWTKPSDKEQFSFADAGGAVQALNAGQTWITIVGAPTAVTYVP